MDGQNQGQKEAATNDTLENCSTNLGYDVVFFINISLYIIILTVSAVAVVANIINMVIFLKLVLKDSLSIGLFSLSFTNVIVSSYQFYLILHYNKDIMNPSSLFKVSSLSDKAFSMPINALYGISSWITAMILMEVCLCVVSPFKVKQIFTRFRCVIAILTIYVIHMSLCISVYEMEKMYWPDTATLYRNETSTATPEQDLTIMFNQELADFRQYIVMELFLVIPLLPQAVSILCSVWIGHSLISSNRIRHKSSYSSKSKLSYRERRLVKVFLIVTIILTVSNIPKLVALVMYYSFSCVATNEKSVPRSMGLMSLLCLNLAGCCSTLVYLTLKTDYRQLLLQCFDQCPR